MKEYNGRVSSVHNGTALDGPGIRSIVFLSGCNMRCPFCHNPETWESGEGKLYSPQELVDFLLRYKNYIKNGGVTFSGGEPFLQAEFCTETAKLLKKEGIHIAVETNCSIVDTEFISAVDLIIADVKNYNGGITSLTKKFFNVCNRLGKPVLVTNVLIKGINDNTERLKELKTLAESVYSIANMEFLPFKKLCVEKYERMNIPFPYKDKEETSDSHIEIIQGLYKSL